MSAPESSTTGSSELDSLCETAVLLAREAGAIQRERGRTARFAVTSKGDADVTTDVDHDCEERIVALVRERHPEHTVLGEEGAAPTAGARYLWVVDPLDGTKNFTHGYARSCVAIALQIDGATRVGCVFNANANELFLAAHGRGATLEGRPICVSRVTDLRRAMVASALVYKGREADRAHLEKLLRVFAAVEAVRSDGCAALDLGDVACGRFDAYFEPGLKPWDQAAGALLVQEAGGTLSRLDGGPFDPFVPELVATNGALHAGLVALL